MKKITVYCEVNKNIATRVSYELLSKAYQLKKTAKILKEDENYLIEAVLISSEFDKNSLNDLFGAGADRVVHLKTNVEPSKFHQNQYAEIFLNYFREESSDVILFPATKTGRMFAPKVTTTLDTGLVADCTDIDFILDKNNEIKLAPTRPTFGAELMATILSKKKPECATIRPNVFEVNFISDPIGEFIEKEVAIGTDENYKLLRSVIEKNTDKIDFSAAKVVLCAGCGLKTSNNEYFEKLKQIASYTNATYAVTRKVVDFGIEDSKYQIGQTGATTFADVYIGFGVSGAIQHLQGMKNAKKIIAVNSDENAPIFGWCDFKVVADAKKIIDEMLEGLR